jgi:hypothetical protein
MGEVEFVAWALAHVVGQAFQPDSGVVESNAAFVRLESLTYGRRNFIRGGGDGT